MSDKPEFLTVEEIANRLRVHEDTILRWIRAKRLKAYKIGRDYRIEKIDYEEFLRERYTGNPDDS
ncbi:MAG TPA: helix-turn-helix domain-containing protein [Ktedonobacteraceae bacterium]|nr:helix-turn-helix domain-containing protein [Ktedonobacteraceae bacterium]